MKEKGPEQPYTKYSVASSKGCTEFLVLSSTECVPTMCPPLPWPPAHPPGRGSRFNLLPLPARGECRGRPRMTFQPCTSFFPLKGGLGHFAKFYLSYIPLGPSSSALGSSPPQPMGRRKFQVRGDEVRAFKFFFFHPCLSVSQKKNFIFQCLSVGILHVL